MGVFKAIYNEYFYIWYEQRKKLAAQDPKWSEIQARRCKDTPAGFFKLLTDDLTWADLDYQLDVENKYMPRTWMHSLHRFVEKYGITTQRRKIRQGYQRVKHGYDDSAWWSIHYWLTDVLPPQLETLAEKHNGVPSYAVDLGNGDVNEGSKIWATDLKDIAAKIRNSNQEECAHDNGECKPELYHCAVVKKDLEEAMVWLGQHWYDLWD